jgi:hypothetical protein
MSGELNLNTGDYVFSTVSNMDKIDLNEIIGSFKEQEGIKIIISKAYAQKSGLTYTTIMSWITLQVHSSLEAVGTFAIYHCL